MDETKQIIDLLRELVELQSITGRSSSSNTTNSFDDSWFKSYKKTIDDLKDTTQDLTKMSRSELEADKSLIEQKIKNGQLTKEEISVKLKLLEVAIKTRISEETKLEVTKKTVKSLNDFQKTLSEVNGDVSKFNKFIEGMGSGAESLIKNSVKLDTYGQKFGLEAGKLGTAVGVAVKALTSLTTAALTQTQQLLKAFDDLSEVGATTYETTASIRKLGVDAGYSGEALLKFSSIAKGVGSNLIGLGTSASSGLKVFSEMAKVGNKTYEAFNRLGVSQEQLTEAQAGYVKQAMMSNAIGKKAPEELRKASLDYVEALVKLRDLTGMNIKEQQSALEAALAQKNFSVYINSRELEAQELRNKASKMQEGEEKQRTIAQMKAIEAEVNGKKAAAIAVSQLDEKTRTAYLQGMSTAGETVMSELVAQQEKLAGHQISAVNRLLNQGKVVEALTLFQNSTVNAVQTSTKTFGSLAALGSGFDEIHDKFMGGAQNYETANRLQRISNEERQKEIEALLKSVETRKQEGIIVDKEGKERADGAKNTQNVINTLGREIGEFKSDVTDALNPFTKSTLEAAAASGALMLAAGGAAAALTLLTGGKILGALGRLVGIGGAGAAGAGAAGAGAGAAGAGAGAAGAGAAGAGAAAASRFGLLRGVLGKVALPLLAANTGYDLYKGFTADKEAGFGSKLFNAGSSALSGLTFGMLGSSPEEIKKRAEQQTGQSKISEGTTTTVESGGQKAVNVNVVQSVPLTVNIDKFLDPLFKLSKLGLHSVPTETDDITLADVNDKVTLPVKISAMSEGFEILFKSMNNHLFIIANKIESGAGGGGASSSGSSAGGSSGSTAPPPAAAPAKPVAPSSGGAGGTSPDLSSVVTAAPGVELTRLDPKFSETLARMAKDYTAETDKKMHVNSAFRDPKQQADLYRRYGPGFAAPPGRSFHERGLAVDINSGDLNLADGIGLLNKYSLARPVRGEPWHLEPKSNRRVVPDNPYAPGRAIARTENTPATAPAATAPATATPAAAPAAPAPAAPAAVRPAAPAAPAPAAVRPAAPAAPAPAAPAPAAPATPAPAAPAPAAPAAAPAATAPATATPAATAPAAVAAPVPLTAQKTKEDIVADYASASEAEKQAAQKVKDFIEENKANASQRPDEFASMETYFKDPKLQEEYTKLKLKRFQLASEKRKAGQAYTKSTDNVISTPHSFGGEIPRDRRGYRDYREENRDEIRKINALIKRGIDVSKFETNSVDNYFEIKFIDGSSKKYDPQIFGLYDELVRRELEEKAAKLPTQKLATGGMILGPGTSTSDSVPAFNQDTGQPIALSTGEYVLPANVTSMLGKGYLDSLISSPNTLKRQKGGSIPGKGGKEIVSSNDLGEGMREVLYSDGSRTLSGGFGTRFFDSSGNLVKMTSPGLVSGLTQTVYPSGKQDLDYQGEHLRVSKTSSGMLSGSYDLGIGSIGMKNVDPRYTAVGGHNKDSQFSVSMRGVDKDVVKTFTGAEIAEMLKQSQNENLVQNALGNTATIIGDPMKEVLNPYLDKQEKMLSTFVDMFGKMLSEMEQSNSTQSNILAYTRN